MVIERFAKKGAGIAGSAVGGGIGGFLSSPFGLGALGLGAIVITLFLFRDRIGEFFGNLKLPELPDIQLPSLPDISFPDITFPTFEFPTFEFPDITFPELPSFEFPTFEFPDIFNIFGNGEPDEPIETSPEVTAAIEEFGNENLQIVQDAEGNITVTQRPQEEFLGREPIFRDAERFARDFPEVFTERDAFLQGGGALRDQFVESRLDTEQVFQGGGVSFIGGSVSETPVSELSLSQIIDRFNVTASQAADIRARARDDFGDFDFGTNTGSGIFGTPAPAPTVSTQGLTAREISRLITQGILAPQFLS